VRYLLECLDSESEGKAKQDSFFIFKDLKCGIKFKAVTIGKHSEHDTAPTLSVICTLLEPLNHR
jgi:hypothetical protein